MKKRTLRTLQDDHGAWVNTMFPTQGFTAKLAHMKKEIVELEEAFMQYALAPRDENQQPPSLSPVFFELADCQLLLIDMARFVGLSAEAHIENCYTKLEICKRRQWGPPNPDGSIEHIREEPIGPQLDRTPSPIFDGTLGRTVIEL
jgi:hypothetical protein